MPRRFTGFTDPTGPGTPAWNAFDNALDAAIAAAASGHPRDYRRYANYRQYMIQNLRRHGRATVGWCTDLHNRINEAIGHEFDRRRA